MCLIVLGIYKKYFNVPIVNILASTVNNLLIRSSRGIAYLSTILCCLLCWYFVRARGGMAGERETIIDIVEEEVVVVVVEGKKAKCTKIIYEKT